MSGEFQLQTTMKDGWEMAAFRSREIPRCCGCLTVRSVSLGLALYVMFASSLFLVFQTMDAAHSANQPIVQELLVFLCGLLLLLVGLGLLCGVLRSIPGLMLPFITFQTLDLFISTLTFCGLFVRFPPCLGFLNVQRRKADAFLGEDEGRPGEEPEEKYLLRPVVYLALASAAVLLIKFYLMQCVWRCYKYIKVGQSEERKVHISSVTLPEKGFLLPSYEEALALPTKEPPPPAYSV